jgi:hypothetical protein
MIRSTNRVIAGQHEKAVLGGCSRYDLQLLVIPAAILLAVLVATLLSVPLELTMIGPAIAGSAAIADGLFLNPPRTDTESSP